MSKVNIGDLIVITKVSEHLRGATPDVGVCGKVVDLDFEGVVIKPDDEDETYYIFDDEYELVDTQKNLYGEVIQWQVGQEVWCISRGKGVVCEIYKESEYSVLVDFGDEADRDSFTKEGRRYKHDKNRSLYFSEPKIIAETMPPEKPFTPTLKSGELVVAVNQIDGGQEAFIVTMESKDGVICTTNAGELKYLKSHWNFYKVSEQVKFN